MRNANQSDIRAFAYRNIPFGIMFDSPYGLVHRKQVPKEQESGLAFILGESVIMEAAYPSSLIGYDMFIVHPSQLKAVTKGPSTTPRKPKNRPKKGTKPWTKIPYRFEDVEVGDIVTYYYLCFKCSHKITQKEDGFWIDEDSVKGYREWSPTQDQQAHILKPYKEPVKPQEEEVYQIGDRFEVTSVNFPENPDIVMLCRVSSEKAMLITESGNRWTDNTCAITSIQTCLKRDVERLIDTTDCTYKKI